MNVGAKALEEFMDNIRNDPDIASNMPRDGTVQELTNHGFNQEFEAIFTIKFYTIPNEELRTHIRTDNNDYVIPSYRIVLEKNEIQEWIARNPEKYIKYSVEDVEKMINKFFNTATYGYEMFQVMAL